MTDAPTVHGLAVRVSKEMYEDYPELREAIEQNGRYEFNQKHSVEPIYQHWYYQEAYVYHDEETGEDLAMPAEWVLLTEGVVP